MARRSDQWGYVPPQGNHIPLDSVICWELRFVIHESMSGTIPMAPTPEIVAEKLAKVAELYYLHNKTREQICAELSADRHRDHPYDPANVNVWLKQAEARHVVAFDIDPSFAIVGERNEILEKDLNKREAFGLEEPIVVDVGKKALDDPKAADLHTALANQTGIRLSQVPGTKTRFLVAGGRTVVHVVRMIKRCRVLWANVRVDPLTGRNWTGYWQVDGPDLQRPLDADDAAVILASACQSGASFSQIGHPLYAETIDQAQSIMREHCAFLPDGQWNWSARNQSFRAICGIGSLHPESGHRIMGFLETYLKDHGVERPENLKRMIEDGTLAKVNLPQKPDPTAPYLSRVALELIAAITFANQRGLGYFGDIANRLYPCLPLPQTLRVNNLPKTQDYKDLVKKLDALNGRAVLMQWSHLRNSSMWITAGGRLKLGPIWTLAITRYIEQQRSSSPDRDESILTQLTTDSVTAQKLLDALDAFKRSPERVQLWYSDLVDILFQDDRLQVADEDITP